MAKLTLIVDSAQAEQALRSFIQTTDGVTVANAKAVSSLGGVVKSLAAIGLAYKTYNLAREALAISDAAERASRLFDVAFDGMGDRAGRWANSVTTSMKAGASETKKAAANFQLMFENMGFGNDQAFAMTRGLTELGTKLEQVGRVAAGDGFQKLESGVMGNARSLRELGVTVNETLVKQYALDQGWIDQGQTLSETGRVYATYRLILDQTAKATGGLSDSHKQYGEQLRRLGVNVADIKEAIGDGLKPVVTDALTSINAVLDGNISKVKRWASDFKEGVGTVQGAWRSLQDENQADLQKLWNGLSPNMQKAVGQAYQSQKGFTDEQGAWHGEAVGYKTITAPGVMGGGAAAIWQKTSDPEYLRKLIESYAHVWYDVSSPERTAAEKTAQQKWTDETGASMPAGTTPAPAIPGGPGAAGIEFADTTHAQKLIQDLQQQRAVLALCNAERERANALNAVGIDETGTLTDKTKALAGQITNEVDLLRRAKQEDNAGKMIEDLRFEQDLLRKTNEDRQVAIALRQLEIDKSDELAGKIDQEVRALEKIRQLRSLADDVGDAFGRAFESIAMDARNASAAVTALIEEIERAVLRNLITQPLSNAISSGIMTMFSGAAGAKTVPAGDMNPAVVSVTHTGGVVGYDMMATRAVSPLVFANAPRYHTGLFPNEKPTILQDGETVLPAGSRPNVTVNIANNSSAPVAASVSDIKVDLRRMVVGIILEDQQTNGPVTRNFRK